MPPYFKQPFVIVRIVRDLTNHSRFQRTKVNDFLCVLQVSERLSSSLTDDLKTTCKTFCFDYVIALPHE